VQYLQYEEIEVSVIVSVKSTSPCSLVSTCQSSRAKLRPLSQSATRGLFGATENVQVDPSAKVFCGIGRNIVDCTTGRVLAKQRSLRPFQHFYAFNIEYGSTRHRCERNWRLVAIDGNSRAHAERSIEKADAANEILVAHDRQFAAYAIMAVWTRRQMAGFGN
jgi:hypothetical protein